MTRSFFICSCIFLLLPVLTFSQFVSWNDINGVPGISLLREGMEGKLFAVSGSRIYFSTDNGVIWNKPAPFSGTVNEFYENNGRLLVSRLVGGVTNNHQLFLSTDNGNNWTRIFSEQTGQFFPGAGRFMVSRSGDVYAFALATSVSSFLLKLTAGTISGIGVQVPLVGAGNFPTNLELSYIDNSDVIFAGTRSGGLYASTNYGAVWTQVLPNAVSAITLGPQNSIIVAADSTASRDGGVFISTDHGTSWTNLGLIQTKFSAISADTLGNILASTVRGNYYYDKSNETWSNVGPVTRSSENVLITRIGFLLASSSDDGIFRSTDKAVSWSQNGPRNRDAFCTLTLPSGTMLAGTLGSRLFKSVNAGAGWHQSAIGTISDYIYSLARWDSTLYAGTDQGLYVSTDGGDHWVNRSRLYVSGSAYTIAVNSFGGIFIGTNFGVYHSTDGGVTWLPSGLSASKVQYLALSNVNKLYAATEHDGIFVSTSDGSIWTSRGVVRDDIQAMAVNPAGNLFVGIYGGILRSDTDTSAWAQHNFTNGYVYSFAFNGSFQVYAGTYNGVFVSFDDGENWSSGGLQGVPILSLGFDSANRLTAGSYHAGVFQSLQPVLGVEPPSHSLPTSFLLHQNYPNPFNPMTTIAYDLPKKARVTLTIYSILGETVGRPVDEVQESGTHSFSWNAGALASGLYFYKFNAGDFSQVKKMLLVR